MLCVSWNSASHEWRVTQLLKPLVMQVDWHRAETAVYSSVHFLGYVGIVTAVKKVRPDEAAWLLGIACLGLECGQALI